MKPSSSNTHLNRYQSFGSLGIWRCGDWRSKFPIIDCSGYGFPTVDFPPGYDYSRLRFSDPFVRVPFIGRVRIPGRPPRVKILDFPVSGFPDVFRDSDFRD
jgi:hypothetical protein